MSTENIQVEANATLQSLLLATEKKVKLEAERLEAEKRKEREAKALREAQVELNKSLQEIKESLKEISKKIDTLGGERVSQSLISLIEINKITLQFLMQECKTNNRNDEMLTIKNILKRLDSIPYKNNIPDIKIIGAVTANQDANITG
jgi:hypothetical protein